ncbi:MAG TPA: DUF1552 domain-containing protein [Humisphaera sp.]
MKTTPNNLSRRTLLRGAGVAMALPLLDAMMPRAFAAAVAAGANPAAGVGRHRMVAVMSNLGLHTPFLNPEQTGRNFQLTPYLEPLAAYKDKLTVVSGASHPGVDGGHSAEASFLTAAPHPGTSGFKNTISLDQYVVEQLAPDTRFGSLVLGTGGNGISWTRSGVQIPSERSPSRMFAKLFLTGSAKEVQEQARKLQQGRSVMDAVTAQAKRMNGTVGRADRDKLDQYFTSVRELEQRLARAQAWSAKPKPVVNVPQPKDVTDRADLIAQLRLMYDVIHLALQTDSSRVVTLTIDGTGFVPPIPGVTEAHHSLSHHGKDPKKIEQLKAIELEEFKALADFVAKLQGSKEEGTTLLDRTSVFLGSNMGNASSHSNKNLPALLIGGAFKHAGHVAFDQENNAPLCNLYVSMLQRMGVETDNFATGKTTLKGLELARV